MARSPEYSLVFAPATQSHLGWIERKYHGLIQREIDEQLTWTPLKETRNRKPLERPVPFGATWELRFGSGNRFRVFYEVDEAEHTVWVLAIGVKERNQLFVGGKEFDT